jgi:hypothetical protein
MTDKRDVLFIHDGAPQPGEKCGLKNCFQDATGVYEIVDANTNEYLATMAMCKTHGRRLATGGPA